MTNCPCGTGETLADCCAPLIDGSVRAERAEQLMRARYTAHVVGEMDFILATHHPTTRTDIDESATARWASESEWLGLDIRNVEAGGPDDDKGKVEFTARYRDGARRRHVHHELGVFERYHGQWYFRDAEMPEVNPFKRDAPKQGRNDPCACGSGLKFKKCCGREA